MTNFDACKFAFLPGYAEKRVKEETFERIIDKTLATYQSEDVIMYRDCTYFNCVVAAIGILAIAAILHTVRHRTDLKLNKSNFTLFIWITASFAGLGVFSALRLCCVTAQYQSLINNNSHSE